MNAHACVQRLDPVKEGVGALATGVSLQGDLLMGLLDKSLPTALGLAGARFCAPRMQHVHSRALAAQPPACNPRMTMSASVTACVC